MPTLVVTDTNKIGVDGLVERLADHIIMIVGRRGYGEQDNVYTITLADTIRNTEAHGLACRLGFLAHIE
jgi:hypothetical protein